MIRSSLLSSSTVSNPTMCLRNRCRIKLEEGFLVTSKRGLNTSARMVLENRSVRRINEYLKEIEGKRKDRFGNDKCCKVWVLESTIGRSLSASYCQSTSELIYSTHSHFFRHANINKRWKVNIANGPIKYLP